MGAVRPARRRLAAVVNPHSGGGRHRRDVPLILSALRGLGYDVEELETEAAGDASGLARGAVEAGFDVVAVLGGDGTVNEVVNGLLADAVALLQQNTGNPAMQGYQSGPARVDETVRAIFQAMQARQIRYVTAPDSWTDTGHLIRNPAVQHVGRDSRDVRENLRPTAGSGLADYVDVEARGFLLPALTLRRPLRDRR